MILRYGGFPECTHDQKTLAIQGNFGICKVDV